MFGFGLILSHAVFTSFIWRTHLYDIRYERKQNKEVQDVIQLINTYTNVVGTRNWLKQQENSLSAIQNKIEEGTELPELLCWMEKEKNS